MGGGGIRSICSCNTYQAWSVVDEQKAAIFQELLGASPRVANLGVVNNISVSPWCGLAVGLGGMRGGSVFTTD